MSRGCFGCRATWSPSGDAIIVGNMKRQVSFITLLL